MELSEALFCNAEFGMFMINNLINVGKSSSEVEIILRFFSSLKRNIVKLEIPVFNGGWLQDQTVAVFMFFRNVEDFLWG